MRVMRATAVCLLALVMAVPVVPAVGAAHVVAGPTLVAPAAASQDASAIPAALTAPWAARTGFESAYLAEVPMAQPLAGTLAVVVSFWPSSPSFFLPPGGGSIVATEATVADEYGLPTAELMSTVAYFQADGLSILHLPTDRLSVTVFGPAADIDRAFGTTVMVGAWQGRAVQFPLTPAALPGWLEPHVAAIGGLTSGFSEFSFDLAPATLPALSAPAQGRTSTYITPSAAHLLYDFSGLYNATGTARFAQGIGIAIVLWGDGYDPNDLSTFFSQYYPAGFPSITLSYHPVDGAPDPSGSATSDPSNAPQELTLDLEWAGSSAPGASLDAVYAPDGPASNNYSPTDASLEDALNVAIDTAGVNVVSMSFGTPDGGDPALQAQFALAFAHANQLGITILAASGDNGGTSGSNCGGGPGPEFPAASPSVVAVGGTAPVESLDALGDVVGMDSEPAWNGSGGGFSTDYGAPSWQANVSTEGHRGIPDVAGPAYDDAFYYGGALKAGRGTSFATPMWAGLVAELDAQLGHSLGDLAPRLYSIGAAEAQGETGIGLVDITSGSNCLSSAVPGWDDVTGWGSPRGTALLHDLSSSFVDVALTTGAGSVVPGGSVSASVTVLNSTSHVPIPNLTVAFTLASSGFSGPCGGTFGTAAATTDLNGTASASLSVPGCYLGSTAVLTVVASARGFYGNASVTIAVNLLGIAGFLAVAQVFPYNVVLFAGIVLAAVGLAYFLGERNRRRLARARGAAVRRAPPAAPARRPPAGGPSPAPPPPAGPPVAPGALASTPLAATHPTSAAPDSGPPATVPDHVTVPPSTAPDQLDASTWPAASPDSSATGGSLPAHLIEPTGAAPCPYCGAPRSSPDAACPACGR